MKARQETLQAQESFSYLTGMLEALGVGKGPEWWSTMAKAISEVKLAVEVALDQLEELESQPHSETSSGEGQMPCSGGELLVEPIWEPTDEQLRGMAKAVAARINHSEWNGLLRGSPRFNHLKPADKVRVTDLLREVMASVMQPAQVMSDVCQVAVVCCACGNTGEALGDFQQFANCEGRPTLLCWACRQKMNPPMPLVPHEG